MRIRIHPLATAVLALGLAWPPLQAFAHETAEPYQESDLTPQHRQQLAALRAATAIYHDFDTATRAGLWEVPVPSPPDPLECLDHDGIGAQYEGAMGYHFVKVDNFGILDPARPQALIYEPEFDGSMRLVAVEFIVPGAPGDVAPTLLGQSFVYNSRFGVWTLHVWAWRHNPSGLFADWNPNVSCRYAL